jgi:hypothetical protein
MHQSFQRILGVGIREEFPIAGWVNYTYIHRQVVWKHAKMVLGAVFSKLGKAILAAVGALTGS